ncbi:MAG: DUF6537 domain-containing protein, partial [Aestuariivirgaceae bacterium]
EGVDRIDIVSDEPEKYGGTAFPSHVKFHHRDDLQALQKQLMEVPGISVLIYDQTCAAEKRRRRKRGTFPNPKKRVLINELICEGCGDCGVQSNCVAIAPVDTKYGRKRKIDQSVCNKDYSCLNGFCPSFVTVEGGELVRGVETAKLPGDTKLFPVLPDPDLPALDQPWSVMVTGIGGTGVVTVGQLLGMAAHLEGKGAGIIDMAGLSQKNGAVVTHLKLAASPADIASIRIEAGGADLILGCDLVTSASERILSRASRDRTHAVINAHEQMPAQFTRDADFDLPSQKMSLQIEARVKPDGADFINATRIATALLGDSIAANLFTLGFAYQHGLIPVSADAIEKAIGINGVAVKMNQQAFLWGRRAAHDLPAVETVLGKAASQEPRTETLDRIIEDRIAFLTDYQDADYAEQYRRFVDEVRIAEVDVASDSTRLSRAVARYLFKLMAYKDEYEVARLYTGKPFTDQLNRTFKGDYTLKFHLAPPLLAKRDPATGRQVKQAFGPWMMRAFGALSRLKGLRGSAFDIFGYTAERKRERAMIGEYRQTISGMLPGLSAKNLSLAVDVAAIPEHIRGYGHVKQRHVEEAKAREAELLEAYRSGKARAP